MKNDDKGRNADEKSIVVVFHAILSDKYKFDSNTKIVIRGEEPFFDGWEKDSVHLEAEK
jgi:hypothetical protein